jgi:isoaspartyl peptidase/L-asparaginase-like protein (Ntn-hydrolase superfamily)
VSRAEPRALLAVHGGAGAIAREYLDAAAQRELRQGLTQALEQGRELLRGGADALEAAVAAVCVLEDAPAFNAGRGSVLASDGSLQLSAGVMRGADRAAGAVAGVSDLRNPVRAALAVLAAGGPVLLIGEPASAFARAAGLAPATREELVTPRRLEELERARVTGVVALDPDARSAGTVGAVARDSRGHLAAATSTGGLNNQWPGRVGDSPIPGAGTWADDATAAISATGVGEMFLRTAFAKEIDVLLRHAGLSLADACSLALAEVGALGGRGGCIAVSARGELALPFTTAGMYRGWIDLEGPAHVALFSDETL